MQERDIRRNQSIFMLQVIFFSTLTVIYLSILTLFYYIFLKINNLNEDKTALGQHISLLIFIDIHCFF